MRRTSDDEAAARHGTTYEESYGDADQGGWAPRGRFDDFSERSHYSSQWDPQEDRSGFSRGYQGSGEVIEHESWPARRARSDEEPGGLEDAILEPGEEEVEDPVRLAQAVVSIAAIRERAYPGGWIIEFDALPREASILGAWRSRGVAS